MSMEPENEVMIKITPVGPEKSFNSMSLTSLDGNVKTVKSNQKSILVNHCTSLRSSVQSRQSVEIGRNATQQFLGPTTVGQFMNFQEPVHGQGECGPPESNQIFPKKHLDELNQKNSSFGFLKSTRDPKLIQKSMVNVAGGSDRVLRTPRGSKKKSTFANENLGMYMVKFFGTFFS